MAELTPDNYTEVYETFLANHSEAHQIALCACGCERMFQNFEAYLYFTRRKSKGKEFGYALNQIWDYLLEGTRPETDQAKKDIKKLNKALPDPEDSEFPR